MYRRHLGVAIAAGTAMLALATPASAWEQIGYQQADMRRDHDTIQVRGNDRYRQIRLCVERSPLRMRDLKVVYNNGAVQDVRVRRRFDPDSCTRAIDLRGRRRNIDTVEMTYDRRGEGAPAAVKVYAR
jgi:hypothetical protein